MTTIASDTSIMSILGNGSSAKYFDLLSENNELSKEDLDRQQSISDEIDSLSSSVGEFRESLSSTYNKATDKLYKGIVNPLTAIRAEASDSYSKLSESVSTMSSSVVNKLSDVKTGLSNNLSNVKDGFSNTIGDLKTGFTDAVSNTNKFLDTMSIKMEAFDNLPTEDKLLLAGKAIADGVTSSISAIPDIIGSGLDKVSKGISSVSNSTKSSSKFLKGLFKKSEESEDVGGTVGVGNTDTKKDETDATGIGGLFAKIAPKGLIKGLGKLGKLAGKLAIPLAVIMGIFDFVGGVKNAAEIVGKPEEQLSNLEKAGAGLSSVLSGLTFGLVDAKSIYSEGKQVIDSISKFASEMFSKLPLGVQDGLKKVGDVLFNPKTGIFSVVGRLFNESIDSIANGDYLDLALTTLTAPLQMLFSADGVLAQTFNGVMSILPDSFKNTIGGFVETIMGWFDKIKNFASDLIPDSLKNLVGGALSSDVGKTATKAIDTGFNAVKGFFGYGDKPEKQTISNVSPTAISSEPVSPLAGKLGGGDDKVSRQLAKNKVTIASRNIDQVSTEVESEPKTSKSIKERSARIAAFRKSRNIKTSSDGASIESLVKGIKDSDTATKRSKELLNNKQDVKPVIINQPAPAQNNKPASKQLDTSTNIGDTELAVMNSNMMD